MATIIRTLSLFICLTAVGCGDSRPVGTQLDSQPPGIDSCCGVDAPPIKLDSKVDAAPTCPAALPADGSACNRTKPCSYKQSSSCPCGPDTLWWDCTCAKGTWSCIPSEHCGLCTDVGPDLPPCPPLPSCNWCGGSPVTGSNGCTVGYVCANGVDPCSTPPCAKDADCKPTEVCAADKLCWPGGP